MRTGERMHKLQGKIIRKNVKMAQMVRLRLRSRYHQGAHHSFGALSVQSNAIYHLASIKRLRITNTFNYYLYLSLSIIRQSVSVYLTPTRQA